MTALSPPPPPSSTPCNVCMGLCTEQERVICVRCKSKCVHGSCLGIAQTTICIGMIFWSCSSCLPNFITELSALDRISALEVKLEKVDLLISEIQTLKLEINFLKKPVYPSLRAAFRNLTNRTASDLSSKKRKGDGNENLVVDKESQDRKPKVFKTATNFNHQTTVSAIKRPPKRRDLYIGRLSNSASTDDITEYCKKKGVDLLCICEISRDESLLKSFHCAFKFDIDQVESPNSWSENVSFSRFYLNQKAREWLASFDT